MSRRCFVVVLEAWLVLKFWGGRQGNKYRSKGARSSQRYKPLLLVTLEVLISKFEVQVVLRVNVMHFCFLRDTRRCRQKNDTDDMISYLPHGGQGHGQGSPGCGHSRY